MNPSQTAVQKFVMVRSGVSFPRIHDFAHQKVLVFLLFGGGGVLATRYSQRPSADFDAKYAKTCGSAPGCAARAWNSLPSTLGQPCIHSVEP